MFTTTTFPLRSASILWNCSLLTVGRAVGLVGRATALFPPDDPPPTTTKTTPASTPTMTRAITTRTHADRRIHQSLHAPARNARRTRPFRVRSRADANLRLR